MILLLTHLSATREHRKGASIPFKAENVFLKKNLDLCAMRPHAYSDKIKDVALGGMTS